MSRERLRQRYGDTSSHIENAAPIAEVVSKNMVEAKVAASSRDAALGNINAMPLSSLQRPPLQLQIGRDLHDVYV